MSIQSTLPQYWSPKQVRLYFGGVSDMWVRRAIKAKGFPPPVKFAEGKFAHRHFEREAVEQWAKTHARRQ
jgi:hypothetical protein